MRPDPLAVSPTPGENSNAPSPPAVATAPTPLPTTRPRLQLQKRTVSEATSGSSPAAPTSVTESKASPFGAARPVDTFAKEKEIEEKRELALRQKREADEKARAEKAEEKRLAAEAKDKAAAEKDSKEVTTNGEKDGGVEHAQSSKNFEILRRASGATNGATDEGEDVGDEIVIGPPDDKSVKPREVIRQVPPEQGQQGHQSHNAAEATKTADNTAESLEEDGWSTVSNTKQRNNKRANPAARAIAS